MDIVFRLQQIGYISDLLRHLGASIGECIPVVDAEQGAYRGISRIVSGSVLSEYLSKPTEPALERLSNF